MPVIVFTKDVGTKFVKGQVVNLPTTTLDQMAKNVDVKRYTEFSNVLAVGANCTPYMEQYRKQQLAESARKGNAKKAAPRKTNESGGRRKAAKKKTAKRKAVKKKS